jgi:hypothetical protein
MLHKESVPVRIKKRVSYIILTYYLLKKCFNFLRHSFMISMVKILQHSRLLLLKILREINLKNKFTASRSYSE